LDPHGPTDPPDRTSGDPLEAALLAGSEALLELQMMQMMARDDPDREAHAQRVFALVRLMLTQLRTMPAERRSALSHGFVMASDSGQPDLPERKGRRVS
jgi:hypothetical protein